MSPASLRAAFGVSESEKLPDLSMVRVSDLVTFARYSTPPGMFVDLAPVHVMSHDQPGDHRCRDRQRYGCAPVPTRMCYWRWMIQIKTCRSRGGPGRTSMVGEVVLDVTMPTIRCVVPSRAQPGFEVNRQITRAVAARAERCLGVYCWVERGGRVRIGDRAGVRPANRPTAIRRRRRPAREAVHLRIGDRGGGSSVALNARSCGRWRWRGPAPSRPAARRSCPRR